MSINKSLQKLMCVAIWVFVLGLCAVAQSEKKVSVGILMDNTGSMRQLAPLQREFVTLILSKTPKDSIYSVFGFATDPGGKQLALFASGLECSKDHDAVEKQINAVPIVGGQTTLMDAIHSGIARLRKPEAPNCPKSDDQLLVVLSDGEDRASFLSTDQFFEGVKASGVKVYVVAIIKDLSREAGFISKSPSKKSQEFLMRLAKDSGGRIVLFKKKENPKELIEQLFSPDYVFPK